MLDLFELVLSNTDALAVIGHLLLGLLGISRQLLADSGVLLLLSYFLIETGLEGVVLALLISKLLAHALQIGLVVGHLTLVLAIFRSQFPQPSGPLLLLLLQAAMEAVRVLLVIQNYFLQLFVLKSKFDHFRIHFVQGFNFPQLTLFKLIQLLPAQVTLQLNLDLINDMLLEAHARVADLLGLLLAVVNVLIGSFDLAGKHFDLLEDTAVELLHEELPVLIVADGLVGIYTDRTSQLGDIVCPLTIYPSQLHVFLQQSICNAFQFPQLPLQAILLRLQQLVLSTDCLDQ